MTHGEKKETSPATSATGMARRSEPEEAWCWNQSATARHLPDDLDERERRRDLAGDDGGRSALGVEDDGRRDAAGRHEAIEGQHRLAAGREERRPGDVVARLERPA